MKLKVLPPTLRKNNRYLVVDIKIESAISKDDLVGIIWDACVRFHGECVTSNFNLWVMKFFNMGDSDSYHHYKAVVRCQRDFVSDVRSAFALVNKYDYKAISITTVAISGTIKASLKFI